MLAKLPFRSARLARRHSRTIACHARAVGFTLLCAIATRAENQASHPLTSTAEIRAVQQWNPRVPHPLELAGTATLWDESRHWLIVQDEHGAVAVEMATPPVKFAPGQRISLVAADSAPSITELPEFPLRPSGREYLRTLEGPSNWTSTYVARLRGFLIPPKTGEYSFWIASDDSSELWLATDAQPRTARPIANVATWTKPKDWGHLPAQRSTPIHLVAGQRYYLEVLHEQRGGVDHLSVSWQGPGFGQQVIDGRYLAPWVASSHSRDGGPLPPSAEGCVLREYWFNCVIPNVTVLSTPRSLGTALVAHDARTEARGAAEFPAPRSVRPGEHLAPGEDFVWSEMEGVVEFVGRDGASVSLELSDGAPSTRAVIMSWTGSAPERLVGQRVKLSGVAEPAIDPHGNRVVGTLWVPSLAQVSVSGSWSNPETYPLTTIAAVLADDNASKRDHPIRVRGKISATGPDALTIADEGSVAASISSDGKTWRRLGTPVELPFGQQLEVGLAISSRSAEKRATAVFDSVQGLSEPRVTAIGQAVRAGELKRDGKRYTLSGSGHDIWQSPDQFCFAHETLSGAGEIVARVADFSPAEEWAKAGIMMRGSMAPDAAFVDLVVTGGRGGCLQWRHAGEASAPVSLTESKLHVPLWLKLARQYQSIRVIPRQGAALPRDTIVEVIGFLEQRGSAIVIADAACRPLSAPTETAIREPTNVSPQLFELARIRAGVTGGDGLTPLRVRGIVTFAGIVQGRRFLSIQDSTGAAFIGGRSIPLTPELRAGRWIDIQCYPDASSSSGDLQGELGVILGSAALPKPLRHPAENALPRRGEAQWIELEGIGRAVSADGALEVRANDALFSVLIPDATTDRLRRYVDARITVRGVVAPGADQPHRLLVQSVDQIEVDEEPGDDGFAAAAVPIPAVARTAARAPAQHRTKISGAIAYVGRGYCYLANENDGARIELATPIPLHVGESIEAIGFPDALDDQSLVLTHASVRTVPAENGRTAAVKVAAADLLTGQYGGRLVQGRAVVSRERRSELERTYELQMENRIFCATLDGAAADVPAIPSGSIVVVTGVCVLETALPDWIKISASNASILPVRLLLRSGADVVVLQKPRWWAVKRTLLLVGGAVLVLGVAGAWIHVLRRRVAQRTSALNAAMEKLRHETQTAATLAERNRLAGEIHDSLEQGFSGLILQLDSTAKLRSCPPDVRAGLALARSMVAFSRKEIRHAVWDLHSPALDAADLGAALKAIVSQLNPDVLQTTVSVSGAARRLGSAVEHHLLRIAQEAIANAVKHSGARRLEITLVYGPDAVTLTVRDDGRGFDPATVLAKEAGHFGLRSLRGRAANVHGKLTIESVVGTGTTVTLRVPLADDDVPVKPTVI